MYKEYLIEIGYLTELLCLIIGIVKVAPSKDAFVPKSFLVLLCLSFGLDTVCTFYTPPFNKVVLYNILAVVKFYYLFFLFFSALNNYIKKILPICFSIIYTFSVFYNVLWTDCINLLMSVSNIIGSFLISFLIIVYFFKIMKSEELLDIKTDFFFWFSTGGLLYFLGSIPFEAVVNNHESFSDTLFINHILFLIYYLCLIIGFFSHKYQIKA